MEEHPVLILSDIMMPEMSGLEMCAKIKSNFDLCHIPVVLLTALTSDNKKMEGLQCGADDFLPYPISLLFATFFKRHHKMIVKHLFRLNKSHIIIVTEKVFFR